MSFQSAWSAELADIRFDLTVPGVPGVPGLWRVDYRRANEPCRSVKTGCLAEENPNR
jgi:hypothetical protein